MGSPGKIYVQIDIAGSVDDVWQLTQSPELHQRWDLRFTQIQYLPRPYPEKPQQFLYATRIGMGLNISGGGESVGNFNAPDGSRSSALKFWSEDKKSLIRIGSGYWKYIPSRDEPGTTRFLTLYDYDVRFGLPGRIFDRIIFRPLIGWATAWSFDRLRLWIEKQITPEASMRNSVTYAVARLTLAFVWVYQGLVPKLLFHHRDELAMLRTVVTDDTVARHIYTGLGWVETGLGLAMIFLWQAKTLLWFTLVAMVIATLSVAIKSPGFIPAPFNPISLNVSVFALAMISLLMSRDLPSATRCVRRPLREEE